MAQIKWEDIAGIYDGEQLCGIKHFDSTPDNLTYNDVVTIQDIENSEDLYFCDLCGEQL